jgi:hypothetical protein
MAPVDKEGGTGQVESIAQAPFKAAAITLNRY